MAKKPSQKQIWIEAAKYRLAAIRSFVEFVARNRDAFQERRPDILEADELISLGRRDSTVYGRSGAYLGVWKDRIGRLLWKNNIVERSYKRSFVRLEPNLKMGVGDKGREKYDRLVELYGQSWVDNHVTVTIRQVPEYHIYGQTQTASGMVVDLEETVEAHIEVEYTFVSDLAATVQEEINWGLAMGNKISVEFPRIPARYKAGKARKGK